MQLINKVSFLAVMGDLSHNPIENRRHPNMKIALGFRLAILQSMHNITDPKIYWKADDWRPFMIFFDFSYKNCCKSIFDCTIVPDAV